MGNNISREQLKSLFERLVHSQGSWNQCVVSEDRGPNNYALAIVIYDDGSGLVADYQGSHEDDTMRDSIRIDPWVNVQQRFDDCDQLTDYMIEYHDALEKVD